MLERMRSLDLYIKEEREERRSSVAINAMHGTLGFDACILINTYMILCSLGITPIVAHGEILR